jgi:hypothetical protein
MEREVFQKQNHLKRKMMKRVGKMIARKMIQVNMMMMKIAMEMAEPKRELLKENQLMIIVTKRVAEKRNQMKNQRTCEKASNRTTQTR